MSNDVSSPEVLKAEHREPDTDQTSETFAGTSTTPTDHEGAIEQHDEELVTRNRIDRLLLELTRDLSGQSNRETIEGLVCKRLAASGLYQSAWIGDFEAVGDELVLRTSAGVDDEYVRTNIISAVENGNDSDPCCRALRTADIQATQTLQTDLGFASWRETVYDHDIRSAAAVPLLHGETMYGCLAVFTTRSSGFNQREQASFEILGEAIGFAIHAIETRRLLFADAVLELDFRLADTDADQFLLDHSGLFECELSVDGYVTTKDGNWLLYVAVAGASPATLCEAATDLDGLERASVIRSDGDSGLVEYCFTESPLLDTFADVGVKLRSAEATAGAGRLVVEAPQGADVREVVDRIHEIYPDVKLVAQRERDRSVVEFDVPGGPVEKLTDRQREALETAYHAGYFEWPRESTGEEVAESMGIAPPTLNRHFRRAQKQLLRAFFDPDNSVPR